MAAFTSRVMALTPGESASLRGITITRTRFGYDVANTTHHSPGAAIAAAQKLGASKSSSKIGEEYSSNTNHNVREDTMKVKTQKSGAKSVKAAKPAAKKNAGKREAAKATNEQLRAKVSLLREKGKSWGEIGQELSITPGKAQFLQMLNEVEDNPKLRIKFKNDEELAERISAARAKADEHSSWGWIAARSGVSEGKVKALAEQAGVEVTGSRIASVRAGANGGGKVKAEATPKRSGKKAAENPSK